MRKVEEKRGEEGSNQQKEHEHRPCGGRKHGEDALRDGHGRWHVGESKDKHDVRLSMRDVLVARS